MSIMTLIFRSGLLQFSINCKDFGVMGRNIITTSACISSKTGTSSDTNLICRFVYLRCNSVRGRRFRQYVTPVNFGLSTAKILINLSVFWFKNTTKYCLFKSLYSDE